MNTNEKVLLVQGVIIWTIIIGILAVLLLAQMMGRDGIIATGGFTVLGGIAVQVWHMRKASVRRSENGSKETK